MAFNSSKITAITGTDGTNGNDGAAGAAAGFGTPAANASNVAVDGSGASQNATITVTPSGPDTAKIFTFALGIPVGSTGATGVTGSIDLTADQTWTGSQRATIVTDNDGSFDLNAGQNFFCTAAAAVAIDFTNETAGQSGFIKLINGSAYAHTLAASSTTKVDSDFLTTVGGAGTFLISYLCDGTNTYLSTTKALA
jgi:hypothetical protein